MDKHFNESFKLISERLEQVHKGLGEMQNLAVGVGDLRKVLTNVKVRGNIGEIQLAALLAEKGLFCEFCDRDYLVLMVTPETGEGGLKRLEAVLSGIPRKAALPDLTPDFCSCERVLSPREAMLAACETLPAEHCVGRILASPSVGCPPAVPIVVSGERIDENALHCFAYYGISHVDVVKE